MDAVFAWVDAIPAVARIALMFVLVLLMIKRNWSLGNAFLAGSLGLGIVFGMGRCPAPVQWAWPWCIQRP